MGTREMAIFDHDAACEKMQSGTPWSIREMMETAAILTFSGLVVSENMHYW